MHLFLAITSIQEFDDPVNFQNAITTLPISSGTSNCTDSLYAALSAAVTSESVRLYQVIFPLLNKMKFNKTSFSEVLFLHLVTIFPVIQKIGQHFMSLWDIMMDK